MGRTSAVVYNPEIRNVIRKFDYEVHTKASAALVWEVFSNWRRWQSFSSVYGSLEWTQGEPWAPGSRLRIEIVRTVHTYIDHVITYCEPGVKVGWIDNAFGIAIEQWVTFEPLASGETRVRVVGEIAGGEFLNVAGKSAEFLLQQFTETWYHNFSIVCDELAVS